jgi:nicotinamidase-related amidase
MEIDPGRAAVIAIHCQGDIVAPDGAFAGFFQQQIIERRTLDAVAGVLKSARAAGIQVVYTRVAFAPDYSDLKANCQLLAAAPGLGCLKDGSALAEIVPALAPQAGDEVITHQRVGGFSGTRLDEMLRSRGIDTVLLTGVATNLSVETTARYASELGYRTIMVEDAMSAATLAAHQATIESLALLAEISSSQEIDQALAASA